MTVIIPDHMTIVFKGENKRVDKYLNEIGSEYLLVPKKMLRRILRGGKKFPRPMLRAGGDA